MDNFKTSVLKDVQEYIETNIDKDISKIRMTIKKINEHTGSTNLNYLDEQAQKYMTDSSQNDKMPLKALREIKSYDMRFFKNIHNLVAIQYPRYYLSSYKGEKFIKQYNFWQWFYVTNFDTLKCRFYPKTFLGISLVSTLGILGYFGLNKIEYEKKKYGEIKYTEGINSITKGKISPKELQPYVVLLTQIQENDPKNINNNYYYLSQFQDKMNENKT